MEGANEKWQISIDLSTAEKLYDYLIQNLEREETNETLWQKHIQTRKKIWDDSNHNMCVCDTDF